MARQNHKPSAIDFSRIIQAKFIKLGEKGKWDRLCIEDGTLRLGYDEVAADYSADQGKQPIFDLYRPHVKNDQTATNHARQVQDFYAAGPETVWITFSGGRLWWCQAKEPVEFISHDKKIANENGSRLKRTVFGWYDCSASGKTLYMRDISGRLTKISGFRGTICAVGPQEFNYLLRLLQDQKLPEVEKALTDKHALQESVEKLISRLTWKDFELLADLIFSGSGWRRISMVGGTQQTIDLELVMPLTDERAVVQVKSRTTQQQLDEYIGDLQNVAAQKIFYVYHTAPGELTCDTETTGVRLMGPAALAEHILRAGLTDWLIEKVG